MKKTSAKKPSRSRSSGAAASRPAGTRESAAYGGGYGGFSGAFSAAKMGGYRGYFFFPTLDAKQQMPAWTRLEINKKANWLYNNVDPVRQVIDGLTLDEVDCGLWPKWTTSNPAFNKAATEAFDNECGDARFFHAAKKETFYSAQWLIRRSIRLYGEIYCQFLRPSSPSAPPLAHFINSWQCADTPGKADNGDFDEGVITDSFGAALKYQFLLNDDGSDKSIVDADDVLHLHDQFWNGQVHGMSGLASCARKLFSLDDIEKAAISGMLMRERMAYAITKKDDGDGLPSLLPGVSDTVEVAAPGGGTMLVQKIMAMDDTEVDVAELPSGMDMKVIESNRSKSTPEFLTWLLKGVAQSTLYPDEYVFNLAGISQGTLARLVQKRVQRIKNTVRHFQLKDQFCKRWITYWTWQRIKSGRFDDVEGGIPKDWWRHKLIMPADDTVDVAREGKLYDSRLEDGNMSPSDYHGMQGRDDEDVEDEVIAAAIRKAKKIQKAMDENPDIADLLRFQLETRDGRAVEAPITPPTETPDT